MSRPTANAKLGHIAIFSDRSDRAYTLEVRLRSEGFRLTTVETVDSLLTVCSQNLPDILILRSYSQPRDLVTTLRYLMRKGISPSRIPTLMLVKGGLVQFLIPLIDIGFKEILSLDTSVEMLVRKIKLIPGLPISRLDSGRKSAQRQSGSRGNLSDFNIIDLLQALGPSQRTARITVTPDDPAGDSLSMYLSRGQIVFAKLGDLLAEKAIYSALTWEAGTWTSEAVTEKDLPEPNNTMPNEFILMEGCRLIDESGRRVGEHEPVPTV